MKSSEYIQYMYDIDPHIDQYLKDAMHDVIRSRFDKKQIVDIEIERSLDHDEDPIFLVRIIFDESEGKLNVDEMCGLIGRLRSEILEHGEDTFPIVSYIEKSEHNE